MNTKAKKIIQSISLLCAAAALSSTLVACSQKAEQPAPKTEAAKTQAQAGELKLINEGQLTLASDFGFPPFEYIENNEKKGFSVELVQAICEKAGLKANWLDPLKFDTLVPLVKQGGKIDVACASITVTQARQQEVDFTEPYIDSNQGILVKSDNTAAKGADLNKANTQVAVQSGTTGEEWAQENLPQAQVVAFDDATAAFAALNAGKVEAVCLDLPVIKFNLANGAVKDVKILEEIPTGEQYAIAVSKDNPELTAKLNQALEDIKKDGTYDKIFQKYFGA